MSQFDVVVFGASGYTGQFVAEEVARYASGSLTWAVAGRNRAKLEAVLAEASKHVGRDVAEEAGVIVADVKDQTSLEHMCSMSKVLISCVGPYRFFGAPVIEACIANNCHYVDICGETEILERFAEKYHAEAEKAGVHIIQTCGFDSIPADLGMLYTIQNFPGVLTQAESFHKITNGPSGGTVHTGTWESLIYSLANDGELRTKRSGLAPFQWLGPKMKKRGAIAKPKETGSWCIPFMGSDVSVVRRSQRARQEGGQHPVQYGCYFDVGSVLFCLTLYLWGVFIYLFTRTMWGVRFAASHPRLLSLGVFSEEGSSRQQLAESTFTTTFYGKGFTDKNQISKTAKPNASIVTRISGPEPGYIACSIMIVQTALCLLREDLPNKGGVLTPAVAFTGTNVISEMTKAGVKFSVVETS